MRRRIVVFGTPLVVLIAIIALFSGGSSKPQRAALAGSTTRPGSAPTTPAATTAAPQTTTTAAATGDCAASNIQVTPSVANGVAGGPIQVNLSIATTQDACNFAMSGANVAVKISSGSNALWSSQNCPNVVPAGSLVLRKAAPVTIAMSWDGHQSNGTCGATNPWVGPGTYQIIASVIGATPTSGNFTLALPTPATVTQTATPTPSSSPSASPSGH